jgi:hypothetical protein
MGRPCRDHAGCAGSEDEGPGEAAGRSLRIHQGDGAGSALAGECPDVAVGGARPGPGRPGRDLRAEKGPHVRGRRSVGVGDDRRGAGREEPGGVVVDALASGGLRPLRDSGLGEARRVAQVEEEDDRPGRKVDLVGDDAFTEVLVRAVTAAGHRVEAEPVLDRPPELRSVRAREAVAVAQVDDDRGTLQRGPHFRPRRVRRVHLDDVGGVPAGLLGPRPRPPPIALGEAADGPDHEHHPWIGGRGEGGTRQEPCKQCPDERDEPDRPAGPTSGHAPISTSHRAAPSSRAEPGRPVDARHRCRQSTRRRISCGYLRDTAGPGQSPPGRPKAQGPFGPRTARADRQRRPRGSAAAEPRFIRRPGLLPARSRSACPRGRRVAPSRGPRRPRHAAWRPRGGALPRGLRRARR